MAKKKSKMPGYLVVGLFGFLAGGIVVALVTRAVPKMIARLLAGLMQNLMVGFMRGAMSEDDMAEVRRQMVKEIAAAKE